MVVDLSVVIPTLAALAAVISPVVLVARKLTSLESDLVGVRRMTEEVRAAVGRIESRLPILEDQVRVIVPWFIPRPGEGNGRTLPSRVRELEDQVEDLRRGVGR